MAALLLSVGGAGACPCSDDAGSGTSLAREDERFAAALVATSRHALGRFDGRGDYRPLARDEAEASEELLLRLALRLPRRVEWLGELGYASYRFRAGGVFERHDGVGDAVVRTRYSLMEEGMPHRSPRWPSFAVSGLLRAPLGALAQSRASGFGSGGAQLGLGAWELGAGLDISRSVLATALVWFAGLEAAYRFEDRSLREARRLGPRADVWVGARLRPEAYFSTSLALRLRAAGDVHYGGQQLAGTGERLLSAVLGGTLEAAGSRLRASTTLSLEPPIEPVPAGATAAFALGVSLAYGVR